METLLLIQSGFVLLTLVYFGWLLRLFWGGIQKTTWPGSQKKKTFLGILCGLFGWTVFVSVWSGSGVMADFTIFPFNFLPVLALPLITVIYFISTRRFSTVLMHVPVSSVIALQSFRFFVELLLWGLFVLDRLPVQMTFEGRNWDILAGITAPVVAWLASNKKLPKVGLVAWNLVCLALLINIVTIAILSTPSPLRVFMNEPSNTAVVYFPISWLPGLLVPLAYTLHLVSLKQLALQKSTPLPHPSAG